MANIQLDWLADSIRAEGAEVVEHDDWKNRSSPTSNAYRPIGLLNHHTAGSSILYNYPDPPYWTNKRLENSCNITIRPDGVVAVLNAGYAYDSGMGDPKVLLRARNDEPVGHPADYDEDDRVNGNPHWVDVEVQHLGTGGPIEAVQYEALILVNVAICKHEEWDPATRLLGHREWTRRKRDPRWNGYANPMPTIRADTIQRLKETAMTPDQEAKLDTVIELVDALPDEIFFKTIRSGGYERSVLQSWLRTEDNIMRLRARDVASSDDIETAVDELIDLIPDEVLDRLYHRLAPGPQ